MEIVYAFIPLYLKEDFKWLKKKENNVFYFPHQTKMNKLDSLGELLYFSVFIPLWFFWNEKSITTDRKQTKFYFNLTEECSIETFLLTIYPFFIF